MIVKFGDDVARCQQCGNSYFKINEEYAIPKLKKDIFAIPDQLNFIQKNIVIYCSKCGKEYARNTIVNNKK